MRVVTILGSPRKQGNTNQVLVWVEQALVEAGHVIVRFDLADYVVHGCSGCGHCQLTKAHMPSCAQDDDANLLLGAIQHSDAFILASPVYCWGLSSQMKAFVDRTYCVTHGAGDEAVNLFSQRRGALVVTAEGPLEHNADLLIKPFELLMRHHGCVDAGHMIIPHCTTPDALNPAIMERAAAFAHRLARR
jgi:multimeric flavodoxin WrbA